jgi:hypothetical protein
MALDGSCRLDKHLSFNFILTTPKVSREYLQIALQYTVLMQLRLQLFEAVAISDASSPRAKDMRRLLRLTIERPEKTLQY